MAREGRSLACLSCQKLTLPLPGNVTFSPLAVRHRHRHLWITGEITHEHACCTPVCRRQLSQHAQVIHTTACLRQKSPYLSRASTLVLHTEDAQSSSVAIHP